MRHPAARQRGQVRPQRQRLARRGVRVVDGESMELWIHNLDIGPYAHAGENQHEPKRRRRLLAHKREIERMLGLTTGKGKTLVPLAMYFKGGRIKLEIGVGTGKKQHDKRQDLKQKSADREMRQGMVRKTI